VLSYKQLGRAKMRNLKGKPNIKTSREAWHSCPLSSPGGFLLGDKILWAE